MKWQETYSQDRKWGRGGAGGRKREGQEWGESEGQEKVREREREKLLWIINRG